MDLGGLSTKLSSKADTIGLVGGFVGAAKSQADYWWGKGNTIRMIEAAISGVMGDPHFPNIGHVITDLTTGPSSPMVKTGIMMWLGGELADGLISPKWQHLLTVGGKNVLKGAALFSVIGHAGLWHSGGDPAGQPYSGHNGHPASYSPLGRHNGGTFSVTTVKPQTQTLPVILAASPKP